MLQQYRVKKKKKKKRCYSPLKALVAWGNFTINAVNCNGAKEPNKYSLPAVFSSGFWVTLAVSSSSLCILKGTMVTTKYQLQQHQQRKPLILLSTDALKCTNMKEGTDNTCSTQEESVTPCTGAHYNSFNTWTTC